MGQSVAVCDQAHFELALQLVASFNCRQGSGV
jgi:hypothetical protein